MLDYTAPPAAARFTKTVLQGSRQEARASPLPCDLHQCGHTLPCGMKWNLGVETKGKFKNLSLRLM